MLEFFHSILHQVLSFFRKSKLFAFNVRVFVQKSCQHATRNVLPTAEAPPSCSKPHSKQIEMKSNYLMLPALTRSISTSYSITKNTTRKGCSTNQCICCNILTFCIPVTWICNGSKSRSALSGRVDLGARQVWGKLGNLLGLLSPAPSDISEFCACGELEASRCLLTCCHRVGEAGLKSTVSVSLRLVHKIMRAIGQVLWLFTCWTFEVSFVVCTDSFVGST